MPAPLASLVLVPALPEFQARYPDILLDLGVSDRKVDIIDQNVDCVVRGGELTDLSLRARHVGDLCLGVYAAPSYLARVGTPESPQEVDGSGHSVIGYRGARIGTPLPQSLRKGDVRIDVRGRTVLMVDDGNAYLSAGVAGLGLLWLPTYMARAALARGELVQLFDDWEIDPMPLYIAFPQSRHVSRKLRVFIDWVVELLASHNSDIIVLR